MHCWHQHPPAPQPAQLLPRPAGESFEGREQQYDWLWNQAKAVLGSNITRGMVKRLVKAYLGIPLR